MRKNKPKKTLKARIIDKICLVVSAIIVQGILIAFFYFSVRGLNIPEEFVVFILLCLFYNAIIIYFAAKAKMVKKYKPIWISLLILILLVNIPFIALFLLMLSGKLTLLGFGSFYFIWLGMLIFGYLTLTCYEFILKKLKKYYKLR